MILAYRLACFTNNQLRKNNSLKDETVLITGATSGIGYETGKLFERDNASLVLASRNEERLKKVATEFCSGTGRHEHHDAE